MYKIRSDIASSGRAVPWPVGLEPDWVNPLRWRGELTRATQGRRDRHSEGETHQKVEDLMSKVTAPQRCFFVAIASPASCKGKKPQREWLKGFAPPELPWTNPAGQEQERRLKMLTSTNLQRFPTRRQRKDAKILKPALPNILNRIISIFIQLASPGPRQPPPPYSVSPPGKPTSSSRRNQDPQSHGGAITKGGPGAPPGSCRQTRSKQAPDLACGVAATPPLSAPFACRARQRF